jgi:solute carrier family 50 (sugar transporter)
MQLALPLRLTMNRLALSPTSPLVDFCTQWAPAISIVLYMAPIPTIQSIRSSKSVGNLPLLPYTSMVASAFLWTTYGYLKGEPKIYQPNGFGLVLGLYYFVSFLKYAPRSSPTLPGAVTTHTQAVLAIAMATLFIASRTIVQDPVDIIGKAGVTMCVLLFASPLAALKSVIQQKSASSIPWPFTIAQVVNCFMWTVAGLYRMKDFNVYMPNGLGLAFSILQVLVKVIYGNGPKKVDLPM